MGSEIVVNLFGPRSLMKMHKFYGPGQLVVFDEMGTVVIGHRGGLFAEGGELDIVDFSGKKLAHGTYQNLVSTFFKGIEDELQLSSETIHSFDGYFCYGHISQMHQRWLTEAEIERGSVLNFGTNEQPLVYYPLFAREAFIGGQVSDVLHQQYIQLLEIANGSYSGNWRQIVIGDDAFHVIGDNE